MAAKQKQGGKGGRKRGRNKVKCERYRAAGRRERNKLRRMKKYLRRHPNEAVTAERVKEIEREREVKRQLRG